MDGELRFDSSPERSLWIDPGLVSLVVVLASAGVVWWQGLPWAAWLFGMPVGVGLVLVRWHYERRHRGSLAIRTEGLSLATRAGDFDARWHELHRVHQFKDQLIFETTAPHRRFTLALDGHHQHKSEMLAALAARARMLNLRWVESLGNALQD